MGTERGVALGEVGDCWKVEAASRRSEKVPLEWVRGLHSPVPFTRCLTGMQHEPTVNSDTLL